jgi:4-hydroxy-tetrahydrodipicolinate synthase
MSIAACETPDEIQLSEKETIDVAELGRLLTAMVTPFSGDGAVDYVQARKLALALLASGSDGLVVCGTTGESPTLTTEEKLRLFAEVKEVVGSRGAVIAGTGNYSTQESVQLTREAERICVDAVMAVVPYYNKPTQEGLFEHFRAIAGSTSLPLIPYNVPARTITNMTPETTIRLSQIDNIVGIKEASGNLEQIAKIIQGARPGFRVWSGNDSDTLPVLALGGYGVISVASHLVGKQIKTMIDRYLDGDTVTAAAMHLDLLPLVDALFIVSNPIPVKYALNHVGFRSGPLRLPLTEPDAKSAALIRETVGRYSIDLPVG